MEGQAFHPSRFALKLGEHCRFRFFVGFPSPGFVGGACGRPCCFPSCVAPRYGTPVFGTRKTLKMTKRSLSYGYSAMTRGIKTRTSFCLPAANDPKRRPDLNSSPLWHRHRLTDREDKQTNCLSVCLSVCVHVRTWCHLNDTLRYN